MLQFGNAICKNQLLLEHCHYFERSITGRWSLKEHVKSQTVFVLNLLSLHYLKLREMVLPDHMLTTELCPISSKISAMQMLMGALLFSVLLYILVRSSNFIQYQSTPLDQELCQQHVVLFVKTQKILQLIAKVDIYEFPVSYFIIFSFIQFKNI